MSFSCTVINISTQSMKRNTTFTVRFATGNFSTAETAAYCYFDTFSAHTDCTANSLFHSTAESNAAFELSSDVFSNKRSIHIRLFDFCDINIYMFVSVFFKAFFELFNTRTAAADNHTRFSSMNS